MPLADPIPELRSLELLHSVAERGSIRQAALAHGISQPAASMRLRTLERTLGLRLLDRSSGKAELTSAGEAVVQWSIEVLEGMRNLLRGAVAVRSEGQTQLRVVASMTVAEYLVPVWLGRLQLSDPDLAVSLQMGNSEHVVDVIKQHGADIGFVEGRSVPHGLNSVIVRTDELVVVVAPSHPWVKSQRPVTASQLANTPLILREIGSGTREVLEAALRDLDLDVHPLIEMGSTTAIKAAIASGSSPGVLSRLATRADVDDGRLTIVPVEGLDLERSIRATWSLDRELNLLARRLLNVAQDSPHNGCSACAGPEPQGHHPSD